MVKKMWSLIKVVVRRGGGGRNIHTPAAPGGGLLLDVIREEIKYEQEQEQEHNEQQKCVVGDLDLVLDQDDPDSKHVVLRRKCAASGEEIAVSALLDAAAAQPLPLKVKVCITKPALNSVLHFDCHISTKTHLSIHTAYYLPSTASSFRPSLYRGPLFSTLDPQLQVSFKEYLIAKGLGVDLTNFLILHLHKRESNQYLNWLRRLEAIFAKDS